MKSTLPRLAIVAPHPVQYHAPLYREIAATGEVDLTVLYCDTLGMNPRYEPTLATRIEWDVPLLEGYNYLFMRNWSNASRNVPFLSRVNPSIIWHLVNKPFAVILLQGYLDITWWLAVLAGKFTGSRLVFRSEGVLPMNEAVSSGTRKLPLRLMLSTADHIMFSCTGNCTYLLKYGADRRKMSLIPCSVDNKYFQQKRTKILTAPNTPKQILGLDEDVRYVLSVARFDQGKRLQDLVYATADCQAKGFRVGIILVGDGPERGKLERIISELGVSEIHMPGWKKLDELSVYYAAADIFALTSEYDASPKALSEALLFGLPAICSEIIGTAGDLVIDGYNGFLVPVGDIQSIADRMSLLLLDDALRQEMGHRSLDIADKWSIVAAAHSVVAAVHGVLNPTNQADKNAKNL